jgi:hypothetical protein
MTGLNHALVGSLIAKALPLPIAIPAAFLSHFILDALPHYGIPNLTRDNARPWAIILAMDTVLTLSLLVYFVTIEQYGMFACAIAALSPDIVWFKKLYWTRSLDFISDSNWLTNFHHRIQQYERPWGLYLEVLLAAALLYLLVH